MEKGILIIEEKNGKYEVKIQPSSGGNPRNTRFKAEDDSLNNKEIEYEVEKSKPARIYYQGKQIFPPNEEKKETQQVVELASVDPLTLPKGEGTAHAPYNFIPLNNKVVSIKGDLPSFDRYSENRNTGYIELEITTKTPIYVRDTLTKDESIQDFEANQNKNEKSHIPYRNPEFYSPSGEIAIPGSSLRGMLRTMVEMVTFGRFGFFDDKRLYYRGLADMTSLREEYAKYMASSYDKKTKLKKYKMSAGIMVKDDLDYYITPAEFNNINKEEAKQICNDYKEFSYHKIGDKYLVISGNMENKKNPEKGKQHDWVIVPSKSNKGKFKISEEDINDYINDKNRNSFDIIEELKSGIPEVPCFYVNYKNDRTSFGHTPMFRLAYKKTIGEHIPPELKDKTDLETKPDYANAIFGYVEEITQENDKKKTISRPSRVFFSDATLEKGQNKIQFANEIVPKVLSEPKPTTFQHYLDQSDRNEVKMEEVEAKKKGNKKEKEIVKKRYRNHYNTENCNIRGNKAYWHNSNLLDNHWFEQGNQIKLKEQMETGEITKEFNPKVHTIIKPVKKGVSFKSKIRFENLSDEEIGALLFALELPEGCCHKIGMAKPLGLGSIEIKTKLFLSNVENRYSSFVSEWNGIEEQNGERFKKVFMDHVNKELKHDGDLWEHPRTKELKEMLTFENRLSPKKLSYMEIEKGSGKENEFKTRPILSQPTKYKG